MAGIFPVELVFLDNGEDCPGLEVHHVDLIEAVAEFVNHLPYRFKVAGNKIVHNFPLHVRKRVQKLNISRLNSPAYAVFRR
jgi:hypothetical protein